MTTSDIMSLNQVSFQKSGGISNQQMEEAQELIASSFSNLMNQIQTVSNKSDAMKMEVDDNAISDNQAAYEKYRFNDRNGERVQDAKNETVSDAKLEEAKEELEGFEEAAVQLIAEACGVSEEEVLEVLENLGITVLDLMNPQQLAQVFTELTGETQSALLVNEAFTDLMVEINQLSNELMATLEVDEDQLENLVSLMETVEEPVEFSEELVKAVEIATADSDTKEITGDVEKTVFTVEQEVAEEVVTTEKEKTVSDKMDVEEIVEEAVTEEKVPVKTSEKSSDSGQEMRQNSHESNPTIQFTSSEVNQEVNVQMPTSFTETVDMMEMIERLAQNIKATISAESQTMEMQLNPEHLGKLYLQVSQKEGAVSAQIVAQNEDVKDALVAQVATLQDKLNQAGVKVEAIEVTVGTHEFERNLEQDQKREEQNASAEESNRGRRNLNLNDLDELSGLMSEEEALVAQIMKDNGNSVDLTA